jgi:hypothetical protein
VNEFDDIIGADVAGEERAKLLGVHEMLVHAGPPPELSTTLQKVPRPGEVRTLRRGSTSRKIALIAAALVVLGITFSVGFSTGRGSVAKPIATIGLSGTKAAPHAQGTIDVLKAVSGNWPMTLTVSGLPPVAAPEYYYVYLVRDGKARAPCGEFVISKRSSHSLTLNLNAPYSLKNGDTWIVTRKTYKQHGPGQTVMQPA